MAVIQVKVPDWVDLIFAWPAMVYRKWKFGYAYRKIYLDEGLWAILDPQDYYRFGCFKWCVAGENGKHYAVRGQRISPKDIKLVRLHRLIMDAPKGLLVDHRNGDSLDNRRANLRLATRLQNQWNRRKSKNTTSRFMGVSFYKRHGKWAAYINIAKKRIHLGHFDSEIEAARIHDAAAKKYRGEFARLNFPEECNPAIPDKDVRGQVKLPG
ncbi:MAG: AP2 domain-containing protein [Sedimentisphaerales bacterium]|jgi:hypothetical protein